MILYIVGVLTIGGAIIADHYQTHILEHTKQKFDKIKQTFIDRYTHHTRDKFAGIQAIDKHENEPYNFDKALDKAIDNIRRGNLVDIQEQAKKNYYNRYGRELTTLPRVPPADAWADARISSLTGLQTKTTKRKTTRKRKI